MAGSKTKTLVLCVATFGALSMSQHASIAASRAGPSAAQDAALERATGDLTNCDLGTRMAAFAKVVELLSHRSESGEIDPCTVPEATKRAITALLSIETPVRDGPEDCTWKPSQRSAQAVGTTGDDANFDAPSFGEYRATLIGTVAQLHDPGSIKLLYNPDILGTGAMAEEALAFFRTYGGQARHRAL